MFQEVMNFSYRRTPLQAFGWYLTFLLIGFVIGEVIGFLDSIVFIDQTIKYFWDRVFWRIFLERIVGNMAYHIVLGIILLSNRTEGVALVRLGVGMSVAFGVVGGLIPLAVLTTRSTDDSPEVTRVFE